MFKKILKFLLLSSYLYTSYGKAANIFYECKNPGEVALTFDDGPNALYTPILLDYLKKENIKATFFINGKNYSNIEESPEVQAILRRQIREGHDIGSHTFFHKSCFTAYDDGTLKENIERLEQGIKNIINLTPRFFRPPAGEGGFSEEYCKKIESDYNPKTEIIQNILGGDGPKYNDELGIYDYDIILWNGDTEDWKCDGKTINTKDSIRSLSYSMSPEVSDPSTNGFIVLIHDVHEYSVTDVVPEIVKYIRGLGYKLVPLSQCIGRKPYKEERDAYKEKIGDSDDGLDVNSFVPSNDTTTTTTPESIKTTDDNNTDQRNKNATVKASSKAAYDDAESNSYKLIDITRSCVFIFVMMTVFYDFI